MSYVETLVGLAEHHEAQAEHFGPFGANNALTVFHTKAAEICRAHYAELASLRQRAVDAEAKLAAVVAERDALLAALAPIVDPEVHVMARLTPKTVAAARAAIDAARGATTPETP